MAPVPQKMAGASATEKRARKARPSHHKGVSSIVEKRVFFVSRLLLWCRRRCRRLPASAAGAVAGAVAREMEGSWMLWDAVDLAQRRGDHSPKACFGSRLKLARVFGQTAKRKKHPRVALLFC